MFVLAGPNGAGKSTLYQTVIAPKIDAPFINADLIQKAELQDQSMDAAYEAARIAEQRRQEKLASKESFITESTFSHPSKLQLIDEAKEAGFRVIVYHVNVRSANISVSRVAARVDEGGHNVPENKIRERFARNQELIRGAVLKADRAFVYDNSALNTPPTMTIKFLNGSVAKVSGNVPEWARSLYKNELMPFSQARLNPAAASYDDVKEIAKKIGGENVKVMIALGDKPYKGKIEGESALHILQSTEDKSVFVAHFKQSLKGNFEVGKEVLISYKSKFKAVVEDAASAQAKLSIVKKTGQ